GDLRTARRASPTPLRGLPRARAITERGAPMPARVLSTDEAKTAITQLHAIVTGGLSDEINRLDQQGKVLSNAEVWDGPLAEQFRNDTWPGVKATLDKTQQELDELRDQLQKIQTNIMTA